MHTTMKLILYITFYISCPRVVYKPTNIDVL